MRMADGVAVRVYLHLPKCGGRTFSRMVEALDPRPRIRYCRAPHHANETGDADPEWILGHDAKPGSPGVPDGPIRLYVLFREPIDRTLSHWHAYVIHRTHQGKTPKGFESFATSRRDDMTRIMQGIDLRAIAVAGRTDRFEEFVLAVERDCGRELPRVPPTPSTPRDERRPALEDEDQERLRIALETNRRDLELWARLQPIIERTTR